jgi:putative oxidoreductase
VSSPLSSLGLLLLLAVTAVVALVVVHLPNGFSSAEGGIEYVLVLAVASVAIAATGPGRLALDALVVRGRRARRDVRSAEPATV